MTKEDIAKVSYAVNRAYCESLGDYSFNPWEEAAEWQKKSCLMGVDFHLANPEATASASHDSWLAQKLLEGWNYGKDPGKKEHPCMVPFNKLPQQQQSKNFIFSAIVRSLAPFLKED